MQEQTIASDQVVMPFVPMFHVLSWGTPFALMMLGPSTLKGPKSLKGNQRKPRVWRVALGTSMLRAQDWCNLIERMSHFAGKQLPCKPRGRSNNLKGSKFAYI